MEKILLNMREAGEAMSCSPWTIRRKIYAGELVGVKIGTKLNIERAELERYIESNRTGKIPQKQ